MKKYLFFILFIPFSLFSQQDALSILKKMVEKSTQVKTLEYQIILNERLYDKTIVSDIYSKINYEPFKVYIKQAKPKVGLETLYVQGERSNQLLINPNGFPWVNINLSPFSNSVLKDSHHQVFHSGCRYLAKVINYYINNPLKYNLKVEPDEKVMNTTCFKIAMDVLDYGYFTHTVKKGETIFKIADKYNVGTYSILERNQSIIDSYDDVLSEGQKLLVPNCYGKKIYMWVNKTTYLPLMLKVYDDKGFLESFEYKFLKVGPVFKSNEFTSEFPGYGF